MRVESMIVNLLIFGILPISFVTAPSLCGMCSSSERMPPKKKSELLLDKVNQAKQSRAYFIDQTSWIEDMKEMIVLDKDVFGAIKKIIDCQISTVILPSSDEGIGIRRGLNPRNQPNYSLKILESMTSLRDAFHEAKIDHNEFVTYASAFQSRKDDNILIFMKNMKKRDKKNIPNTLLEQIRGNIKHAFDKRAPLNEEIKTDLRTALNNLESILDFNDDYNKKKQPIQDWIQTRTGNLNDLLEALYNLVDGTLMQMQSASILLKKSFNSIRQLQNIRTTMLEENNKVL